jgi:2-keto-4-pentenoate hydratase
MTDAPLVTSDAEVLTVLADLARGGTLDDAGAEVLSGFTSDVVDDGARLQLEVLDGLFAAGETVGGWKIGWTSRGARTGAGAAGDRPFGYILDKRVLTSGAAIDLASIPVCKLEPEIALILGESLSGADVTPEQARAAVRSVAPSFEVNSSRLRPGMSLGVRVGNSLNNWGIVVGAHRPVSEIDLADLKVTLFGNGLPLDTGTSDPDVLDDPFVSLAKVASYLHQFGRGLEAGQVLITGSLCAPTVAEAGTRYEAVFGALGSVSVRC